ncbi:MAG: transcriptional regulator [Rhizobiales bacterium]|nr:transcriptional regulator [Hyphomicrobiales bacterium]
MTKTISPAAIARNERMRLAAENGAIALAEVRARDIAVRKNMERLRALRLEKEASEPAAAETPARRKRTAKKTIAAPA